MDQPTLDKLNRYFSTDRLEQGWKLGVQEKVDIKTTDAASGIIRGNVYGRSVDFVEVTLTVGVENGDVATLAIACQCGHREPCAHAAAVLFEIGGWKGLCRFAAKMVTDASFVNGQKMALWADRRSAAEASNLPPAFLIEGLNKMSGALPPELVHWQGEMAESQSLVENSSGESLRGKRAVIAYVLHPVHTSGGERLKIDVIKAKVLKSGSFGWIESFDPFYFGRSSSFVTPEDLNIFRLFNGFEQIESFVSTMLTDEFTVQVLKRIVATGRCFFVNPYQPALTWGPPRHARPEWVMGDDCSLRAALIPDPPASIYSCSPLIYVDPDAKIVGVVETEMPAAVANTWLMAPPVAPAYRDSVQKFAEVRGLPLPPALPEAHAIADPMRPVLTFFSSRYDRTSSGVGHLVTDVEEYEHWGVVQFEYGPIVVKFGEDAATEIDRRIDGKRYTVQRDRPLEEARIAELQRSELKCVKTYHHHEAGKSVYVYRWMPEGADLKKWRSWMSESLPALQASGWTVNFDSSCILRQAAVDDWFLDTGETESAGQDWFQIDLGIVVDGQKVSLLPVLRKIFSDPLCEIDYNKKNIMVSLPDGRCINIPTQRLRKIRDLLMELYSINPASDGTLVIDRLRAAQFAGVDGWKWSGSQRVLDLVKRLSQPEFNPVAPPAKLQGTLRPYQLDGLNWLQFLREYDLAGVLADDMGLGKTVQALAHLLTEKQAGRLDRPALVIAPTSLMANWRDETLRFAPDLRLLVLHGTDRHAHFEKLSDYDLIVTSYPLLRRDKEFLKRQKYHIIILDEAQTVKNPATLYAQTIRQLTTRHRLALTGTPMENHLGELWAIFDFLMPGFLGNQRQFRTLFRDPIEKGGDKKRREVLAGRIAPLIMRRRKSQVALELPPKNEMVQSIEITGAQRDLYESIRVSMESRVRDQIASLGLARSHIVILDALLKLRQVCCDPRLLKIPSAGEITESAKLEWLVETLPSMVEEGRRILLFSQFTSMLAIIEQKLNEMTIPFVRLAGDTTDRDTPVKTFQRGETPVFLISLKAGGTGLNLTAADTVIHYDPWWNPAVENQATDRAHRIGQDKTVFVYKLITLGTVEEKIQAMQQRKAQLLAGLLDEGGQTPLKLGEDDLRALFAPLN
jgi:superfamily II DNA or RNA helicase